MRGAVYYTTFTNPRNEQLIRIEWKKIDETINILRNKIEELYPTLDIKINKNTIYNITKKDNKTINRVFRDILKLSIQRESIKNINYDLLSSDSSEDDNDNLIL